jgi:hypothetical protein
VNLTRLCNCMAFWPMADETVWPVEPVGPLSPLGPLYPFSRLYPLRRWYRMRTSFDWFIFVEDLFETTDSYTLSGHDLRFFTLTLTLSQ